MEELIKLMKTSDLVELLNDTADTFSSRFPYIMDLDDQDRWEEIQDCLGAYKVACAIENGRFRKTDKYMIVCEDGPILYTFSDNETLFGFLAPCDIAQICRENDIELAVNVITR